MLHFFISLTLLLLFTACNPSSSIVLSYPPEKEKLLSDTIARLPIPFRENGYSKIETKLYTTQSDFNRFISKVKTEKIWNKEKQKNVIDSLQINPIDFTKYNLLIYTMEEPSGSTKLTIDPPKGNNAHVEIQINRETAKVGTSDMAYYALAYKVKKNVLDITFDNGVTKKIILNNQIKLSFDNIRVARATKEIFPPNKTK